METMETKEIYDNLVKKLKEVESIVAVLDCEVLRLRGELETAEQKLNSAKNNKTAYEMAKTALEMGEFELEAETNTPSSSKKEAISDSEKETQKVINYRHKTARLIQEDRKGNQLGIYRSQTDCARAIGWDQSSLSRFLKFKPDQQDAKKGFHFKWEY